MAQLIPQPTTIAPAGNEPKLIHEYIGRVNSGTSAVSIARMTSPGGWVEPGQRPQFDEYTVVLRGTLRIEHEGGAVEVRAGHPVEHDVVEVAETLEASATPRKFCAISVVA